MLDRMKSTLPVQLPILQVKAFALAPRSQCLKQLNSDVCMACLLVKIRCILTAAQDHVT